jgi:carboxylesterase type B
MSVPEVQHKILNATFKGAQSDDEGVSVHKFLGIKYASVPARFERAVAVDNFTGATVDATTYGYVYVCEQSKICISNNVN